MTCKNLHRLQDLPWREQ